MTDEHNTFSGQQTGDGGGLGPGTVLSNYELREPLGAGAMGQVWKAWDGPGQREVAVKILPPELRGNVEAIALVRQSFQQVHALTHSGIGKTLAMLEDPQHGPYIVMDLVPGMTLSAFAVRSRQEGREFGLKQVVKLLRPIAEGLDYAHSRNVLHRDVKPQNILVQMQPFFQVTLIDFGLAAAIRTSLTRHTRATLDTRGTRPYMSPEQFRGKSREWDGRTDQYSLAVVTYELLGGYLPFESDDEFSLMYAVINEPADPIRGQSETVNAALLKGLAKSREDRFPTCVEFIEALTSAPARPQPPTQPQPTPPPQPIPQPRPTPAPVEEPYAAIAFSTQTGRYGWTYNCASALVAEQAALNYAQDPTAEVVVCRNDFDYFVLATGGDGRTYGYGYGSSLAVAQSYAVGELQKLTRQNVRIQVKFHRTRGPIN